MNQRSPFLPMSLRSKVMILQNLELRSRLAPALPSLAGVFGRRGGERRWHPPFANARPTAPARDATPRPVDSRTRPSVAQPYRLQVTGASRSVAQEALNLLWREFAESGLAPQRVSLRTHPSSGLTRLTVNVSCDSRHRVHLVRFVQQVSDLPGVRGVRWETIPPAEFESRAT
jgi:hypothetical protein